MASKRESVTTAVLELLTAALPSAVVEREADGQSAVPEAGHVVLRDRGSPEPERTIGAISYWHQRGFDIEVYASATDILDRFEAIDAMLVSIDAALSADRTIGGSVQGCEWSIEQTEDISDEGADTVRTALVTLTCEYQTDTPLG